MSRLLLLPALLLLTVTARAEPPDPAPSDPDAERWTLVSEGLVDAVRSDNLGVRCSALQHIVTYGGDQVDVRAARFEIVRLFRDHKDPRVRTMALAALTQIDDRWVTDFLFRSARFERDELFARLVLHAAHASKERTS